MTDITHCIKTQLKPRVIKSVYRVWTVAVVIRALLFSAAAALSQGFTIVVPMPVLVPVPVLFLFRNGSISRSLLMAQLLQTGLWRPAYCVLQPPRAFVEPAETIKSTIICKKKKLNRGTSFPWSSCKAAICGQCTSPKPSLPQNISVSFSILQLIISFSKRVRNVPSCPTQRQKASSVLPEGRDPQQRLNLEQAPETPSVGMCKPPFSHIAWGKPCFNLSML